MATRRKAAQQPLNRERSERCHREERSDVATRQTAAQQPLERSVVIARSEATWRRGHSLFSGGVKSGAPSARVYAPKQDQQQRAKPPQEGQRAEMGKPSSKARLASPGHPRQPRTGLIGPRSPARQQSQSIQHRQAHGLPKAS